MRTFSWIFVLVIYQMMSSINVNGECLPMIASADSTVNAPVLYNKNIGFIANPTPKNSYDTRLLSFSVKWWTVSNRTLSWAGIGDDPACSPFIIRPQNRTIAAGGWSYTATNDCFVEIRANYTWPESLFNPACNQLFTTDDTDPTVTTVKFDIITKFNEFFVTTEAGSNVTKIKTVSSKLPVTLTFPKDVKLIATAAIHIDVAADIINQNISSGSPPYLVTFVTYHNKSFSLDQPRVEFSGQYAPINTTVALVQQELGVSNLYSTWTLNITPSRTACYVDGIYRVTFSLHWTGADQENPLRDNSTITVALKIQAQSICTALVADDLIVLPPKVVVDDCVVLHFCLCLAVVILIGLFLLGCICGCAGGVGSVKVRRKFALMKKSDRDEYTYKPPSSV